nr:PREDICTED: uncharacterized protein LOC109031630 isoform X1 [Bemisia tabaci]
MSVTSERSSLSGSGDYWHDVDDELRRTWSLSGMDSADVVYNYIAPLHSTFGRKRAMTDSSVCGFIDAKVPTKGKRFGPWKSWRRQWCMVKRIGNRLEVQLSTHKGHVTNKINVPHDAIICRSESRSRPFAFGIFYQGSVSCGACVFLAGESETETQKWMANIRDLLRPSMRMPGDGEFSVSVIDNDHSRAAGLIGLYGILSIEATEITIRDPYTDTVKVRWPWSTFYNSFIPSPVNSEDVNRICVLQTGSSFNSGIGNLKLFCPNASELHESLSSCQRNRIQRRLMHTPLPAPPSPPPSVYHSHSHSHSPTPSFTYFTTPLPASPPPASLLATRRMSRSEGDLQLFLLQHTLPRQALLRISQDDLATSKSTNNLLFASVGLLMTTPGSSVPGSMTNLAQCHAVLPVPVPAPQFIVHNLENLYKDKDSETQSQTESDERSRGNIYERLPRKVSNNSMTSLTSGIYEEIDDKPVPPPQICPQPPPLPPRSPLIKKSTAVRKKPTKEEESDYVPMSLKSQPAQEYVAMVGRKHKSKLIVSDPVPI